VAAWASTPRGLGWPSRRGPPRTCRGQPQVLQHGGAGVGWRPPHTQEVAISTLRASLLYAALLCASVLPGSASAFTYDFVNKLVDSSDASYGYGYAPSILYEGGQFHMFYCSSGSNGGWDDIRYVTSTDGRLWSAPRIVLTTSNFTSERCACDPSVVYYQAPGDARPYYYLFYSGNAKDVQTVMLVARSESVAGPYAKWTTSGTWQVNAPNPQIIIRPRVAKPDGTPWYGAGQQTVVVRDGKLVSWFTDDTTCATSACVRLFHSTTTSPTQWPAGTQIDVFDEGSVDVKYDAASGRYVMFSIPGGHSQATYLTRRYSTNGVNWTAPEVLRDAGGFPNFVHNVGASGDRQGHLIADRALIVYGAPYDLEASYQNDCNASPAPYCWGHWDLYGSVINAAGKVWNDIPWGWKWPGYGAQHQLALGDYDGDKKTDRAIVDTATGRWFVLGSAGGLPIPWGWQWSGMATHHLLALGDYDGDGRTDRAIVDPNIGAWYVIASSGSSPIPWGWQWSGQGPHHRLALGDHDGDGKMDRTIIDTNSWQWYSIGSMGPYPFPWGWQWAGMGSQHRLALGDYDGDRKTDRTIVDPATGTWSIVPSSGAAPFPSGWQWSGMGSHHRLAVGDYDGDKRADRAIVDPTIGAWYVLGSAGGYPIPWGWRWGGMSTSHLLALGDYDGDGKTDRAIIDPSNGRWFVLGSEPFRIY